MNLLFPISEKPAPDICGLIYIPDFIGSDEETSLLTAIYDTVCNTKMILYSEMDISTTRQWITDKSLVIGSKKALQIEIYNKTIMYYQYRLYYYMAQKMGQGQGHNLLKPLRL